MVETDGNKWTRIHITFDILSHYGSIIRYERNELVD